MIGKRTKQQEEMKTTIIYRRAERQAEQGRGELAREDLIYWAVSSCATMANNADANDVPHNIIITLLQSIPGFLLRLCQKCPN